MGYRLATKREIKQAAEIVEALEDYEGVFNFAVSIYGESVVKVNLQLDHNFDDGEEHRYIVWIEGYDKYQGKLKPDLSLPFWQQRNYTGNTYEQDVKKSLQQEIQQWKGKRKKYSTEEYEKAYDRLLIEACRDVICDDLPDIHELDFYHTEYIRSDRPGGGKQLYIEEN